MEKTKGNIEEQIKKRLEDLSLKPVCEEKLKGKLSNLCRSRVGDYRIVYKVETCNIFVIEIGKREHIYEKYS